MVRITAAIPALGGTGSASEDVGPAGCVPRITALRHVANDFDPMSSQASNGVGSESIAPVVRVVGASVADIVESVGGWLFDQSMAGWRVTAMVIGDDDDERPLRILGISGGNSGIPGGSVQKGMGRRCLAVATESFEADPGVRRLVLQALDDRRTEVVLWGGPPPPMLSRRLAVVPRRVGAGAAAFKMQAIIAAGVTPSPADVCLEVLHTNASGRSHARAVHLESGRAINDSGHGGMQ